MRGGDDTIIRRGLVLGTKENVGLENRGVTFGELTTSGRTYGGRIQKVLHVPVQFILIREGVMSLIRPPQKTTAIIIKSGSA